MRGGYTLCQCEYDLIRTTLQNWGHMDATASVRYRRSTFFFRFIQATTVVSLLCLVYLTVDFVLHPFDPPANGAFPAVFRLVYMLLLMPVTLLIGFLIVRRVPDNLIGWFVLNWGC